VLASLDLFIVNVALPEMARDLGAHDQVAPRERSGLEHEECDDSECPNGREQEPCDLHPS
jgi:hypothetical protein